MVLDSSNPTNVDIGNVVRVVTPAYAAGSLGYVKGREEGGRWLIEVRDTVLAGGAEFLLLSLEQSDFEVLAQ